ncbi:hypothetical protein [Nocardia sp. NPDC057668]|uniref:hypothetical protein n=1 Tax=Nocardia sp. NPDC057668 TaxID=3346202 RepID=UPI00366CA6DF
MIMSLYAAAYEVATLTPWHERTDDCYVDGNGHEHVWLPGHEHSRRGLFLDACYELSGRTHRVLPQGYGTFSDFREALCCAAHVVGRGAIWEDPESWSDRPFFEFLYFPDNEGHIGPVAAAELATDFTTQRDQVATRLSGDHQRYYDDWMTAFGLAANTGLVIFG